MLNSKIDTLRNDYTFVKYIDRNKGVSLVMNNDTGCLYIKKELDEYNTRVYEQLQSKGINGIPKIKEIVTGTKVLCIVEDYIYGQDMAKMYDDGVRLTEQKLIEYMIQLTDILTQLHKLNPPVIHRDIKPSNLMINEKDQLFLIDYNPQNKQSSHY